MTQMNRRDFLKTLGLSAAGTALIAGKLKGSTYSTIDDAIIKTSNHPSEYTTREVRDHFVRASFAGVPLSVKLNNSHNSAEGWEIVGYSPNIEHLSVVLWGYFAETDAKTQIEDVGKNYQLIYRGLDEGSTSSGTVRVVDEEIDRYLTKFTVDYIDSSSGTPQQYQINFRSPNSVTKLLMGWNPDDDIDFQEIQTLERSDASQNFVNFFANLQSLLHDEENALGLSRIVNRNTLVPVPDPNSVYGTLALLDAVSQGDVTKQDELYPHVVTLKMANYVH